MDGCDSAATRVVGAAHLDFTTVDDNGALVGRRQTAHDVDQCRFSGTILTQNTEDFSGSQPHVDVVEGSGCAVTLRDPAKVECRRLRV